MLMLVRPAAKHALTSHRQRRVPAHGRQHAIARRAAIDVTLTDGAVVCRNAGVGSGVFRRAVVPSATSTLRGLQRCQLQEMLRVLRRNVCMPAKGRDVCMHAVAAACRECAESGS